MAKNPPLQICDALIQPGEIVTLGLSTPEVYSCVPTHVPIYVAHGKRPGPCLLICAAMHGDEVNGISIINKFLNLRLLKALQGTLLCIPVLNVFGLVSHSRYQLDRRDLDGAFPGRPAGTYTDRLAHMLNKQVISLATHIIDLHTGAPMTHKLSQVETNLDVEGARNLAQLFNAPVTLHAPDSRHGMLWKLYDEKPIPTIVYSVGQAHRLDEVGTKMGVKGIVRCMKGLGMLGAKHEKTLVGDISLHVRDPQWSSTPSSGLCHPCKRLGAYVKKGDIIAEVHDPFGPGTHKEVLAEKDGVLIAYYENPLVNEGDGIFLIASVNDREITQERQVVWRNEGLNPT